MVPAVTVVKELSYMIIPISTATADPACWNYKLFFSILQTMKPSPYFFLFLLGLFFSLSTIAQQKRPSVGREPSWVTLNQYNPADFKLEHEAEDGYADIIFDKQVSLEQQSFYFRKASKILTEAGIQNCSEISVNFDPSYQQLIFHSIKIRRDNSVMDQLNLSKIKTIQQEKELNNFLYNGSLTAILFLEDVRKGDLVEYSYTLKGANPVFQGKFSTMFETDFSVPIGNIYYKLIVPKSRTITIKNKGTSLAPAIQTLPHQTIYEWKLDNVKAIHVQDNIPGWYDPYSMIMISEYQSWKEVNDWAMKLFPVINDLSSALQKKIADIRVKYNAPEEQTLAVLRFIQDDIRYMGMEMGENSHKPNHPNKIFSQRFGDCKDKSYLLCTMLRLLGIEASPVLINTQSKKLLTEWLPAANSFDHVTVRVHINNKYYWFDPTISLQRGDIDHISFPDYQYGLVIQLGTSGLTEIKVKEPGMVKIKESFDIRDMTGNARLAVTTKYSGSFADDVRYSFSTNSRNEMQKTYREYYAAYYEDITADSLAYSDNDTTGVLTIKEYYSIQNIWEVKNGIKKAFFYSYVIDGVLKKPKDTRRTMPFYLSYPAKYKEEIEIKLIDHWDATESSDTIETSSFLMTGNITYKHRKFLLDYEYESLKDHVLPDQLNEFMEGFKNKENNFSYVLSKTVDGKPLPDDKVADDKKSNASFYIGLFVLVIIGGVVWRIQR